MKRCPQPGFNMVAMNHANPMCFPCIVKRGFLAHERGFPSCRHHEQIIFIDESLGGCLEFRLVPP